MTNEELKKKLVEIIINAIWKDAQADYDSTDESEARTIADALIAAGLKFDVLTETEYQKYCAYKIIEPQIKGCLDREKELEKRLAEAEHRAEVAEKAVELPYRHLVTLRLLTSAAMCYAITKNRITERMVNSKDIADLFMHIPLLQGTTLNFALDYLAESNLNCNTIQGFEDIINATGTFKDYIIVAESRLAELKGEKQ